MPYLNEVSRKFDDAEVFCILSKISRKSSEVFIFFKRNINLLKEHLCYTKHSR